jgi:hypothetical protein
MVATKGRSTMSTQEVANAFTSLCRAGNFAEAGKTFWADKVVSIEPMSGPMARLEGRKALEDKGKWFSEHNTVHELKVEGPFVNGDEFTVRFEMDMTPKGKSRTREVEVALYKVQNDKVVEEKFFFGAGH